MTSRASKNTIIWLREYFLTDSLKNRITPTNPKAKLDENTGWVFTWASFFFFWGGFYIRALWTRKIEVAAHKLSADYAKKQLTCLMIVQLWRAHSDHKLQPLTRQAIRILNFKPPIPKIAYDAIVKLTCYYITQV